MTGEDFVRLCYKEKENTLNGYFADDSTAAVSEKIAALVRSGADREALRELLDMALSENYYSLLLALDGEAALGGEQHTYRIYDDENNLLSECGELEAAAFTCFMDDE